MNIYPELKEYIYNKIIPEYDKFDIGHKKDHIEEVIENSLSIVIDGKYQVDVNMVYTIAAYHDLGLPFGREFHHQYAGKILMADPILRKWFNEEQMITMKEAVEDHRASKNDPPRSIYGMIISDADRDLNVQKMIRRTLMYNYEKHPNKSFDEIFFDSYYYILNKYGENGYVKSHLHHSFMEERLEKIRQLLKNEDEVREIYKNVAITLGYIK